MLLASSFGVVSVVIGLAISYHLGTAGSATVALVPVVAFFLTLTIKTLLGRSATAPSTT
jgi:manganese/iron transport system permease protein